MSGGSGKMNRIMRLLQTSDVTKLVEDHLAIVQGTRELEEDAKRLIESRFEMSALERFIRAVHGWGGQSGSRNLPKILRSDFQEYFVSAYDYLNKPQTSVQGALNIICNIPGLGVSYGSKHLRFIRPDRCAILDSVVRDRLGYSEDAMSYRLLCDEASEAAGALTNDGVHNPMCRADGVWYVADVDMAVFCFLQKKGMASGWAE